VALSDGLGINFQDVHTGKILAFLRPGIFTFTANGNYVWLAHGVKGKQLLSLYDVRSGVMIREFKIPYKEIRGIVLNKNNSAIALMIYNNNSRIYSVIKIDSETGNEFAKSELDKDSNDIVSNGTYFATYGKYGSNGYINLWDFKSYLPFQHLNGFHSIDKLNHPEDDIFFSDVFIEYVNILPQSNIIIALGPSNNLRFWDIKTGNLLGEVELRIGIENSDKSISISPDGRLIALVGVDGKIRLWGVPIRKN